MSRPMEESTPIDVVKSLGVNGVNLADPNLFSTAQRLRGDDRLLREILIELGEILPENMRQQLRSLLDNIRNLPDAFANQALKYLASIRLDEVFGPIRDDVGVLAFPTVATLCVFMHQESRSLNIVNKSLEESRSGLFDFLRAIELFFREREDQIQSKIDQYAAAYEKMRVVSSRGRTDVTTVSEDILSERIATLKNQLREVRQGLSAVGIIFDSTNQSMQRVGQIVNGAIRSVEERITLRKGEVLIFSGSQQVLSASN